MLWSNACNTGFTSKLQDYFQYYVIHVLHPFNITKDVESRNSSKTYTNTGWFVRAETVM